MESKVNLENNNHPLDTQDQSSKGCKDSSIKDSCCSHDYSAMDECAAAECLKNRKNKPPNLQLSEDIDDEFLEPGPASCISGSDMSTSPDSSPFVTLRTRIIKTLDAGASLNSPMVKRTSRLDEILEIPDVAAALVRDEGYELLIQSRRLSRNMNPSIAERQQTPKILSKFTFDHDVSGADTESTSSTESSALGNATQIVSPNVEHSYQSERRRIPTGPSKKGQVSPLELISDNTSVAKAFGVQVVTKDQNVPQSPTQIPVNDNESSTPYSTPKVSRKFFTRLKTSMSRSSSNSSIEGWESLTRALARVAKNSNEPLPLSILKKRIGTTNVNGLRVPPVIQDPGMKSTIHKKTVSFSRLPSEACVKNATDCVNLMQGGHQFVKMRSNSRVYNRLYWLDDANNCLRWEPSKKDSGKARIEISSVREVRPGKATELFLTSDIATHFPDECSFSIIYGEMKTLDLIANSADEANVWVTGLRCLMSGQDMDGLRMRTDLRDSWLGSTFDDADINKDGLLDENESLKLITSLSGGVRELQVKQKLQEYLQLRGRDKSLLSRDEFIEIFKDVATRPEIYFLLARYASGDDRLTLDDLLLFLESEQGMTGVTHEYCTSLIHDFEPSETMRAIPALGIDGFTKFLMSDRCGVFDQKHTKVCQDMSQPLSHYFISSSHNTYLMEDQVNGPSSVSAYVRALLRCCRCVELDCWDGPDGLPVVSHGHTPTNKISFRQVIEAIGESAFRNSTFPVILCIENHCSEAQQTTMAADIRQVLGERVYTQDLSSESSHLPSPGALQRRFLIRSKKLPLECTEEVGYVTDEDEGSEIDQSPSSPTGHADGTSRSSSEAERRRPLVRDLSNLVSICSCVRFIDFQAHERIHKCSATSSLHEQDAAKLVENEAGDFVNHNKTYLTRVYPSGARMDSSNFNPQDYWNCGVQIASLNYQTPGLMMDINDGRFAMNGACGYVLKPSIMRDKLAYYSCQPRDTIPGVSPKMLHLRVISGQNFPKPRGGGAKGHVIDPYVLIELFGLPNDCSEQRTRTAPNNSGDSPLFDESFEFRLSLPSLALVRFVVLDDEFIGDEFIGQYTIPFECLLPGYRHLRLRSIFDEPLDGATLFVHVAITEPDTSPGIFTGIGSAAQNSVAPRSAGKRSSAGKRARKGRSKKETEVFSVKEIGLPTVDDIFKTALTPLKCATNLMDTQRWSLAHFRETCGMAPLASPKQCVRALAQRARSDAESQGSNRPKRKHSVAADGEVADDGAARGDIRRRAATADATTSRLRRQASDLSKSSTDSGNSNVPQICIRRRDLRLSLELRGATPTNETWRKTGLAFDALVADAQAIIDKGAVVAEALSTACKKASKIYEDLPSMLGKGDAVSDLGNEGSLANGSKKPSKSNLRKKLSVSGDSERRARRNVDENFRWNYSVVKGANESLNESRRSAETLLADLWSAAVQYGVANKEQESTSVATTPEAPSNGVESNRNGNNNSPTIKTTDPNGTRPPLIRKTHSVPDEFSYPVTLL